MLTQLTDYLQSDLGLWTLFVSGFISATILPGGSEVFLVAVLKAHPDMFWPALGVITLGNTLGGMTSYWLGRLFPERKDIKHLDKVRRWGPPILFFSWLPWVGDALCVAAGWLRINFWSGAVWLALGKFVRYWVLAELLKPLL
jgi:membrane protein YqaA with SNARE-associated domain